MVCERSLFSFWCQEAYLSDMRGFRFLSEASWETYFLNLFHFVLSFFLSFFSNPHNTAWSQSDHDHGTKKRLENLASGLFISWENAGAQHLPALGGIYTDANETHGEQARWKLYKNITCYFKQILEATPLKTAALRPLTPHLINHPIHVRHCWRIKDELIYDVLLWTFTPGHTSVGHSARIFIF